MGGLNCNQFHVLSRLMELGYSMDLGFRFAYLEEKREAVEEAEGLHLGLLSSRDELKVGFRKCRVYLLDPTCC